MNTNIKNSIVIYMMVLLTYLMVGCGPGPRVDVPDIDPLLCSLKFDNPTQAYQIVCNYGIHTTLGAAPTQNDLVKFLYSIGLKAPAIQIDSMTPEQFTAFLTEVQNNPKLISNNLPVK